MCMCALSFDVSSTRQIDLLSFSDSRLNVNLKKVSEPFLMKKSIGYPRLVEYYSNIIMNLSYFYASQYN